MSHPLQRSTHEALCMLLILASSIKSAQLFAHLWLPDSMEAPIPASSLIHSATLVSAGVYLLLRFQFILIDSLSMMFIGLLGSLTAAYGSIVSSSQTDAKKLLAYSTISHCGFLFVTIYLLNIELTLLYLYLHGFFKALTFFCVGNLVKVAKGHQDTRKMGQFTNLLPIESIVLVICCLNLGGLPFTVGFYYKHFFQVLLTQSTLFSAISPLLLIAMLLGIIYSYRLISYSLFDIKKSNESVYLQLSSKYTLSSEYTNSAKYSILAILTLFMISLIYFYEFFNFYSSLHSTKLFSQQLINNELFFVNINSKLSVGFIVIFCKLFTVVILMLCVYATRTEFTSLTKKHFSLYMLLFILFFCL
jgi:NADH:ubiquinone oxidoreductase subunit 5 (subunit L)/multisubunit Na+/H+ antiporter MnhA subunit